MRDGVMRAETGKLAWALRFLFSATLAAAISVFAPSAAKASPGEGVATSATNLRPGDCVLTPDFVQAALTVVPCTQKHTAQVFATEAMSKTLSQQEAAARCNHIWQDTYDVASDIVWIRTNQFSESMMFVCQVFTAESADAAPWVYTSSYLDGLNKADHTNFIIKYFKGLGLAIIVCLLLAGILLIMWLGR
jgi:hypothetical protein